VTSVVSIQIAAVSCILVAIFGCAGATPDVEPDPDSGALVRTGIASYYGHEFHGRTTASRETYDEEALTAAHRTLPFGSRVRVTNLENGKTVSLRINDRGPFVEGRIIDVSYRAARDLDFVQAGLVRVRLEILNTP